MHNPSPGISQCPSAVLSASLVPTICTPPLVARPLPSSSVHFRAPSGSPRVLRLLSGAVHVLVSAGLLVRPAGCLACRVPYHAVPCGSGGVHVSASVRLPEIRMAWLALRCRGVPYSAAGWVRRNTPLFASRSRRSCWSRAMSPWPIACSAEGSGGEKGIRVSVGPPLSLLDADSFRSCGECVPRNILAGYMCRSRPGDAAVRAL